MATQTNDAVLLPVIFVSWKILREFTYEDNFNNTFSLKSHSKPPLRYRIGTKLTKRYDKQNSKIDFYEINTLTQPKKDT